jgi:AcrR family transcriptional regulator
MAKPPNPELRNQRSHRAILDSTWELTVLDGYARVTIERIAAHAGVGKQTIYRWWPSKGTLALDAVNEKMGTATNFPDTGDIVADLKTQITALSDLLCGDIGVVYRGVIAEAQYDPTIAAAVRETIVEPRLEQCRKRLDSAIAAGELRADIPTRAMVEMLYGPVYYRFLLQAPESDLQLGADHVGYLVQGLRA